MDAPMTCSATLPRDDCPGTGWPGRALTREEPLDSTRELDRFLKDVERRAFRIAEIALRNADDSLDVVQESMIQLARNYGGRDPAEWKPLFYRILQNRIRDWQRRRRTRSRVFAWWTGGVAEDDDAIDPIDAAASAEAGPAERLEQGEAMGALERAIGELPARQQQAFLLRTVEGLDVAATATAMGCSQGSVKTHYFRALQTLRGRLGEHWP
jgi:RNA polymerase sigma-70 factor (ECF subfamily)